MMIIPLFESIRLLENVLKFPPSFIHPTGKLLIIIALCEQQKAGNYISIRK